MKGYKGFDKNFKCQGYQYAPNSEHAFNVKLKCCPSQTDIQNGFGGSHFCENALDVLSYYPPLNNRYAEVEALADCVGHEKDTKQATTKIKIGAEINLKSLISGAVKFIFEKTKVQKDSAATTGKGANAATTGEGANAATTGDWANAATTGEGANAATTGEGANAATTGEGANAATTGKGANAATTGDWANAATTGDWANAATTGYKANAATTGYKANAATTGDWANAEVSGTESIAAAIGINNKAKASKGCWIVLSEWEQGKEYKWHIKSVKSVKVDGKKIKADTFYKLENGKFVEVK